MTEHHARRYSTGALVVLVSALVAACGSVPESQGLQARTDISQAELAIENANQSGAADKAAADLFQAREKLARAREALDDGDEIRARRLAQQARADARLAEARAEAQTEQEQAASVRETVEAMMPGPNAPN